MLTPTVCAEIEPTAVGAVFASIVAVKVWATVNLLSLAVTVIVDVPSATPVMLTVDPDTLTVALVLSEELAV